MSPERTHAYRRVVQTLSDLGPSKLLAPEQDRIRCAADTLIFSSYLVRDPAGEEALADVERLCRSLVESGRWEYGTAVRLEDDVRQCGPGLPTELRAA